MEARVLRDYEISTNDFKYNKNQIIKVTELYGFYDTYVVFHNLEACNVLDWIPKELVEII